MNERKEGFIYIFTIILISLLALFFYFIYSYTSNTSYINFHRVERVQSKYVAESVLNMKISEENFNKELKEFILSRKHSKNLSVKTLPSDTKLEKLVISNEDFVDKNNNYVDLVELRTEVKYKNSLVGARIRADFVNKIYKEEDGVLNSGKINKDEIEKIKSSFDNNNWSIPGIKVIDLDGDFIYGEEKGKKFIFEEVEEFDEKTEEKIIKRNPLYSLEDDMVINQRSGSLKIESRVSNQILILNDKVLFNDNAISGIIIVNNNAQISNNCKLEGYLIDLYDKNPSISLKYHPLVLRDFSSVLPDYIKFQPRSLNYYDLEDNT